ncbi:MAG: sensor histidine kinase [Candidatus Methylomirabilia bacterium]
MHRLGDEDLLKELTNRIEEKNRALFDLRMATKRLEEVNRRLVESEALKGQFLSNIRNEINNPLAVIIAMAGEISAGIVRDQAECRALSAAIQGEAFNLDFQMRNIFCAAEIEAGEALTTAAQVDLRPLVEATVSSFGPLAAARGVELRTSWEEDPGVAPLFTTDPAKVQLILANLLSNALKFGGGSAAVQVVVQRGADELRLSVEDRGIGIDAADHAAIFERFRQLEGGLVKAYAGHGLGLSIVKALLELLGGTITVDSGLGRGSCFTALIPETKGAGSENVFSDAGNEFFFDA